VTVASSEMDAEGICDEAEETFGGHPMNVQRTETRTFGCLKEEK